MQKILPTLADTDRMLKLFIERQTLSDSAARSEACIAAVLQLKQVLHTAPSLAAALTENEQRPPRNELLQKVVHNLQAEELAQLLAWIDEVVEADAIFDRPSSQRLLQCLFSVKPGVKTTLDLCRQARPPPDLALISP